LRNPSNTLGRGEYRSYAPHSSYLAHASATAAVPLAGITPDCAGGWVAIRISPALAPQPFDLVRLFPPCSLSPAATGGGSARRRGSRLGVFRWLYTSTRHGTFPNPSSWTDLRKIPGKKGGNIPGKDGERGRKMTKAGEKRIDAGPGREVAGKETDSA